MKPQNLLIIMSDEHNIKSLGCYGSSFVKTPNIDALAKRGTRFESTYCTSPVCIPSRASFATGKYIHQVGFWDNADPYDGSIPSWHHHLRKRGHEVVSIGKLHFRSTDDDNGFTEEILPMHVIDGKGDLMGLVRDDLPERGAAKKMVGMAGPGESMYTRYDRDITAQAQIWLQDKAKQHGDKPWALFVSLVAPHFPLTAPAEHFYRYYNDPNLPMPKLYDKAQRPQHPFLLDYTNSFVYDKHFKSEDDVRRAVSGYYGLCSFLDEQIGKIMTALEDSGLLGNTRVMYTSDHGDNLGARGAWGKSTLYEESAAVPLIIAGEGIPENHVVKEPTSHVDTYPFILESLGEDDNETIGNDHLGISLFELANGRKVERAVLTEYHGMGSSTAAFMVRFRNLKFVHYVKYDAQLFDLEKDPEELEDVAKSPAYAEVVKEGYRLLTEILDPVTVDNRCRERQAFLLEKNGGREAVIARGDLGFSVPPGVEAEFI